MTMQTVLAVLAILTIGVSVAIGDPLDTLLSSAHQQACGLTKLTAEERECLLEVFVWVFATQEPYRAARLYVENSLGLSSEIDVDTVDEDLLILSTGEVLRLYDTSSFSDGTRYLADDSSEPSEVLDEDGEVQSVYATYSSVEDAIRDE